MTTSQKNRPGSSGAASVPTTIASADADLDASVDGAANAHVVEIGLAIDRDREGGTGTPLADNPNKKARDASGKVEERLGMLRFATLCWTLFLAGWSDATIGPLIPRMREEYNINFIILSLLFIIGFTGFTTGALSNIPLYDKFGFGKTIFFGSILQIVACVIIIPAPPYPVFLAAIFINAMGSAIQDAQANGFVGCIKTNAEAKMGLLHAVYGAGALVSPLVSTQFAQMTHWSFHWFTTLGIAISNTLFLSLVFRFKTLEVCLAEIGEPLPERTETEGGKAGQSSFRQIMGMKVIHLMSVFILVYVGVEVTFGGWIVTYVIDERGGGPASGYVSSAFFGGLTAGRILLLWVNKAVGERRVLFIYAIIAIGLDFVIWFVPSFAASAASVAVIGLVLGPMYPIVMNQAARIIPHWLLPGSIGWIAGFGQGGSALIPFITGAVSERWGIKSMQPLLVVMMIIMVGLWALIPPEGSRPIAEESTATESNSRGDENKLKVEEV